MQNSIETRGNLCTELGRLCIDKGCSSYSSRMNTSTIVLRLHSVQGGKDSCRNAVLRFSTENT